jgi:hypothetical protein
MFSAGTVSTLPNGDLLHQSAPERYVAWSLVFLVFVLGGFLLWRQRIGGHLSRNAFDRDSTTGRTRGGSTCPTCSRIIAPKSRAFSDGAAFRSFRSGKRMASLVLRRFPGPDVPIRK